MVRRILLAFGFLLLASAPRTWAQLAAFQNHCLLGATAATTSGLSSTNYLNGVIPSCTVTVYFTGTTTLAPIYGAATGSGSVASVTVTAGGSYSACPTGVTFSGGGGTGAAGVPSCTGAAVSGVAMTSGGSGYTSAPTVAFTGGTGSGATGTAVLAQTLSNPFTANTISSVNPGGWLFWAAQNTGYDVVMSGGIPPLTYPAPVTLTDVLVGSTGGGVFLPLTGGTVNGGVFVTTNQPPPVVPATGGISSPYGVLNVWAGQINTASLTNFTTVPLSASTYFMTPGWSRAVNGVNWSTHSLSSFSDTAYTEGIQLLGITNIHTAPGDTIDTYLNNFWYGGATAGGDESSKLESGNNVEQPNTYTATINGGSGGAGATNLATTCSIDCHRQGQGRYLIDSSRPIATGCYMTSHTGPGSASQPATIGVGGCSITASTAVGTQAATIPTPLNNPPTSTTPETFTVNVSSGTFTAGGFICFSATFHECAIITSATAPSGGQQTLTVPLREYHGNGGMVVQGGTQGYIDILSQHGEGGLTYPLDVIGASDSTHLLVKSFYKADQQTVDFTTTNINLSGVSVSNLSNSGTTVSFTYSGNIPNTFGPFKKAGTVTFTGASDSAFNATCTSAAFTGTPTAITGTCTIAGLSGTHTSTSATMFMGDTPNGNGDFTLYPGAEVLDVQDPALIGTCPTSAPDCMVDGYLVLEPNTVAWTAGDTVIEPHHYAVQALSQSFSETVHNPNNFQGGGVNEALVGIGNNSGNYAAGSTTTAAAFAAVNNTPYSSYAYGGNSNLLPPNAFTAAATIAGAGVFENILWAQIAPAFAGNVLNVGCPETGCADSTYYYNLNEVGMNAANYVQRVIPSTDDIIFEATSGNVHLLFGGGSDLNYYRGGSFDDPANYTKLVPGGLTVADGTFPIWQQTSWTGGKLVTSSGTGGGQSESTAALTGGGTFVPTMAANSGFTIGHVATFATTSGQLQDGGAPTAAIPIRAGAWTVSASTSTAVTFSTAMSATPTSCQVTPSGSAATTGSPFATALATTGFTVNVPTSGTLSGTYLCALNNAN